MLCDKPTKRSVRSRFVHVKNWDRYQMTFYDQLSVITSYSLFVVDETLVGQWPTTDTATQRDIIDSNAAAQATYVEL